MILNKFIKILQTTDINVHLFVLLQNIVPLPIPTFVWCRLLGTDVSVGGQFRNGTWTWLMERGHDSSFVRHSVVPARDDCLDAH